MTYAIDPELAAALPMLPVLELDDLPATRAGFTRMLTEMPQPDTAGVLVEDRRIPGPAGAPDVPIRIYRPEHPVAPAAVYDVHGGGFILGSLENDHAHNLVLARELGVVVVSVEYRLAPETPFPGPLEDVYAGLVWIAEHAAELDVDPGRIAIHGASAGGGLCAGLALLARDRGGPHIAFQHLSIPELDDRLITPSITAFTDTPIWNRPNAVVSWDAYLGPGMPGTDGVSPYAAPARATDLAGLPPAYVAVMHFDPLRDEGIAYALAMLAAGVTVELHLFPGTFHGSGLVAHAAVSQRETAESIAVLRQALAL
jgi:acetyl esterase/lipase